MAFLAVDALPVSSLLSNSPGHKGLEKRGNYYLLMVKFFNPTHLSATTRGTILPTYTRLHTHTLWRGRGAYFPSMPLELRVKRSSSLFDKLNNLSKIYMQIRCLRNCRIFFLLTARFEPPCSTTPRLLSKKTRLTFWRRVHLLFDSTRQQLLQCTN